MVEKEQHGTGSYVPEVGPKGIYCDPVYNSNAPTDNCQSAFRLATGQSHTTNAPGYSYSFNRVSVT